MLLPTSVSYLYLLRLQHKSSLIHCCCSRVIPPYVLRLQRNFSQSSAIIKVLALPTFICTYFNASPANPLLLLPLLYYLHLHAHTSTQVQLNSLLLLTCDSSIPTQTSTQFQPILCYWKPSFQHCSCNPTEISTQVQPQTYSNARPEFCTCTFRTQA